MFAAIFIPQFALQAALRLREEAWARPIAIVEGSAEKGCVLAMTPVVAACGVTQGMSATQAMARCAALQIWPRSPVQEEVIGALLLEMAGTLSPWIEATSEGLCTVDLRRAKAEDWSAWAQRVVERFAAQHLQARVGLATTPDLAALAAMRAEPVMIVQHPEAFLAGIAVAEVESGPELVAVLRDWGIHHLGDLARLPRSELVERLGPGAGTLWEHAAGRAQRELRLVRVPEIFFEVFDFECPIETTEPLLFILRRQLDQLSLRLREAYRVAAQMTLTLPLDGAPQYERVFTIPSPTGEVETLLRILHTHLENLHLAQSPVGVRLLITPIVADAQQFRLFESPLRDPNRFGETLGRLHALLGEGRVGVVQLEDTHQPDRFQLVTPKFARLNERPEAATQEESRMLGLPLRRFRPPRPAQVRFTRGVPTRFSSAQGQGEITDAAGPYRASGNWWDQATWSIEEWDIELNDGALYRLSKHGDSWFVEGCYQTAIPLPA